LFGKTGRSGGKSNGTGLSTGNFSEKKEYLQRYSSFLENSHRFFQANGKRPLFLCFKTSLRANLSYEHEMDLLENKLLGCTLSCERISSKTRFGTVANSEMAYWPVRVIEKTPDAS